jgi:biopolymer transport protein ExbD
VKLAKHGWLALGLLGCLALFGCSDRAEDARGSAVDSSANPSGRDARAFASAELPIIGGGEDPRTQLWIEITAEGRLTVNGAKLSASAELLPLAIAQLENNPHLRAFITADAGLGYGALFEVIDLLKQAGISRMAFDLRPTSSP